MNEANHLNYNIAEQLMVRTRKKVFIDYNPTNAFWVHTQILKNEPDKAILIKSTYKDNPFLEQSIVDFIESRRGDGNNNFWRVYGLGELGIAEGLVFNNFEQRDFDINRFEKYRNGVDWGFSNDPFAYIRVAIEEANGQRNLYICKEIYQTGLLNKDSAPLVKEAAGNEIVRCDSAEPKSVQDFIQHGIKAISVKKGPGSIESGVKFLQSFDHIYIHPSCPNTYDEFCNYQWRVDKNGDQMPEPVDAFNHCLIAGTMVLTENGEKPIEEITTKDKVLTRKGFKRVLWSGISDHDRKVYKVETDKGNYIVGTENHKILTNKGFCDIDSIRYGDKVLIRRNKCLKQSKPMEENGQDIHNQKDVLTESTTKADVNICTTLFGRNLSGKERKGLLYTIKTAIHKTTIYQILKKSLKKSICKSTLLVMKEEKKQEKILKKEILLKNGIQVKKVENGISNTQKIKNLAYLICQKINVNIVEKSSNLKQNTIDFAQINVNQLTEESKELITLLSVANGVEPNLKQINTLKQDFVVGRVLTVQEQEIANNVYDLTVEDCHEFFANGILVHNCIDAIRYALEDDMSYRKAKAITKLW